MSQFTIASQLYGTLSTTFGKLKVTMNPQTIVFCSEHWDTQNGAVKSADLRNATLRTGALLFLSSAIAIFAVMATTTIPTLLSALSATAIGKLLVIVGFNLFAGYMLVDALSELRRLYCLHWGCQTVEAMLVSLEGEAFKQAAAFGTMPKQPLAVEIGYQFVCPESGRTLMDSRLVKWGGGVRPKTAPPKTGDRILLQYVNPQLYIIL